MNNNISLQLHDYVVVQSQDQAPDIVKHEYKWSHNDSKRLIDLYGKYKRKVGTLEIKTAKILWQKIAEELKNFGVQATANNCLNRWRVLERNYKKYIDNQNKTGRGRKYFEYEAEMNELFEKKRNIHPELLLASDTVDVIVADIHPSPTEPNAEVQASTAPEKKPTKRQILKKHSTSLEKLRADRKIYYESKLEIEREKLEEIKKINRLIEERNQILKEKMCNCQCNSLL